MVIITVKTENFLFKKNIATESDFKDVWTLEIWDFPLFNSQLDLMWNERKEPNFKDITAFIENQELRIKDFCKI